MAKEIEVKNEEGEIVKETVYTAEEFTAKEGELKTVTEQLTEARKIAAEKGENLKKFSQMSEAERSAFDANTINLLRREEQLSTDVARLTEKLTAKEKRENEAAKNNALSSIHHGDENTKKLLEEKYALLSAMPETTPTEIAARTKEAAKLAGIQIDPRNPLYTGFNGEAPVYKPKKEYVDTPAGTAAADAVRARLGIKTEQK